MPLLKYPWQIKVNPLFSNRGGFKKPCEHTVFSVMTGAGDDFEELFPYISEEDRPQIEAIYNSEKDMSFYLKDLIKKVEVPNSVCFYQESDSAFMSSVEGYLAFAQREVKHD